MNVYSPFRLGKLCFEITSLGITKVNHIIVFIKTNETVKSKTPLTALKRPNSRKTIGASIVGVTSGKRRRSNS